jgi:putative FmdB family regulatory protein
VVFLKVDHTAMPLYEYQCDACEHRFEKIQKFSDPQVDVCPKCGGVVKKLVSSPAIQFKGTGWYITDYAKKSSTDASSGKSSSDKSDKTEKSEKSSDTSSSSDSSTSTATTTSTTPSKD